MATDASQEVDLLAEPCSVYIHPTAEASTVLPLSLSFAPSEDQVPIPFLFGKTLAAGATFNDATLLTVKPPTLTAVTDAATSIDVLLRLKMELASALGLDETSKRGPVSMYNGTCEQFAEVDKLECTDSEASCESTSADGDSSVDEIGVSFE